jgi:uncharacterized protein (TIGR02118 family)
MEIDMIKTQWLAKRKPGITLEAFADYWLSIHVPITAKIGEIRRQTISIVSSDLQRGETPWDGLANIWWEAADELASARKSDAFMAMIADQANFVDLSVSGSLIVHEINPVAPKQPPHPDPELIKIVNPLHKREDLSYEAFSAYWSGPHAALNNALPHMNAYIQNHVHPDFRASDRPCDGIAESWFKSWDEIRELSRSEANARLKEDEANLLAPDSLYPMVCREHLTIS